MNTGVLRKTPGHIEADSCHVLSLGKPSTSWFNCFHCHGSDDGRTDTRPPLLVTASVDAIDLKRRLRVDKDMIMAGEVTPCLPCALRPQVG